jgi:hypothetical protein
MRYVKGHGRFPRLREHARIRQRLSRILAGLFVNATPGWDLLEDRRYLERNRRAPVKRRGYDTRCRKERSSTRMTPACAARRATSTCSGSAASASR